MMQWHIIDTGKRSASENMLLDEALLEDLEDLEGPVLHFYDWEGPSATYGYFLNPYHFLDEQGVESYGLNLAKRPTGGGVTFHIWDLAFSVAVPATCPFFSKVPIENYAFINRCVIDAVSHFQGHKMGELLEKEKPEEQALRPHFCMARPTKYDVMMENKKLAGAAQRKTRFGYLHQGSISLCLPSEDVLFSLLKKESSLTSAILQHTFPLLKGNQGEKELEEARNSMKESIEKAFKMALT